MHKLKKKILLKVVFGMERVHQYTYGRKIHVESDRKPLEVIHKKALHLAPKHLQRMLLRLQQFEKTIKYKEGKYKCVADTLSRAYTKGTG